MTYEKDLDAVYNSYFVSAKNGKVYEEIIPAEIIK